MNLIRRLPPCDDGVTSIEYALIASLIAVVIVGALTLVGVNLVPIYNTVAAAI